MIMWTAAKRTAVFVVYGLEVLSGILAVVTISVLSNKLGVSIRLRQAISVLNCLSGGVFFATSIMHLLPEAREKLIEVFESMDIHSEYPVTEGLVGVGFLLILLLETTARKCCSDGYSGEHYKRKWFVGKGNAFGRSVVAYKPIKQHDVNIDNAEDSDTGIKVKDFEDSSWVEDGGYCGYGAVDESHGSRTGEEQFVTKEREFHEGDKSVVKRTDVHTDEGNVMENVDMGASKLRGIILLTALSFHMVFDGIALGLLSSDSKVWTLLLALSIHKVLVFFSLGIQAYEILKSFRKTIGLIVIISFVSPLGIWIGVALTSGSENVSENIASGVLQGIATGTFLYVTFFEILHKELNENKATLLKVAITVVGFVLVAAVRLLENEDEDHRPADHTTTFNLATGTTDSFLLNK